MSAPRRIAALLAVVWGTVACGTAPPPAPRFAIEYASIGNHPETAPLPLRLGIARFEAKPMYDRLSIAWREDDAYGYYTTGKWADLPGALLTEAVFTAARKHGDLPMSVGPRPHGVSSRTWYYGAILKPLKR